MSRTLMLLLLALASSGCRPATVDPEPAAHTATPAQADDPSPAPDPVTVECGAPIDGAEAILRGGALVMLGELHGTREIPAFIADLACDAARRGQPVRLGVEIPRSQSEALAAYLASPGGPADREALLDAEHWQRPDQDGRSSEATVALLDRMRVLRQAGLDIDLFAFDANAWADWNERDRMMAERILERTTLEPAAVVLTLSGNLHNRTVPGLPWDPNAVPMGVLVRKARSDALSLDVRHEGGTAWICVKECGVLEVTGKPEGAGRRIDLRTELDEFGQHGTFSVGPITAAPPAVSRDD